MAIGAAVLLAGVVTISRRALVVPAPLEPPPTIGGEEADLRMPVEATLASPRVRGRTAPLAAAGTPPSPAIADDVFIDSGDTNAWIRRWVKEPTSFRSGVAAGLGDPPTVWWPAESAKGPLTGPLEVGRPRPRIGLLVGVIKRIDGEPIGGATVLATPEGTAAHSDAANADAGRRTSASTSDGRFSLSVEEGTRYTLAADVAEFPPATLHGATIGVDAELWVVRYASAIVRLRDPEGRAIEHARVEAQPIERRGGATPRADTSDADGLAELRGIVAGARYRLIVMAPSSRPELADRRIDDWSGGDLDVDLSARR